MDMEKKIDAIESRVSNLEKTISYISEQVSNHIPSTLTRHGEILEALWEKEKAESAISNFFKNSIGRATAVVGLLAGSLSIVYVILSTIHLIRG